MTKIIATSLALVMLLSAADYQTSSSLFCQALVPNSNTNSNTNNKRVEQSSRRAALGWFGKTAAAIVVADGTFGAASPSCAIDGESDLNIDAYLKSGGVSMPMGVSGQGGKMRPNTGVVLRDGSEVSRDPKNGDVLAEIVLKSKAGGIPVLASFSSPWPLATGPTFDVECRDGSTGDGAYLAVSADVKGKGLAELSNKFFQDQLFSNTGRFSFYGAPTDVKVTKSTTSGNYRTMDISFSILSQSTGAEVLRKSRVVATIPDGSTQVVMLMGSASALRWKKGTDQKIAATIESFRAIPAPQTSMRIRAKESA